MNNKANNTPQLCGLQMPQQPCTPKQTPQTFCSPVNAQQTLCGPQINNQQLCMPKAPGQQLCTPAQAQGQLCTPQQLCTPNQAQQLCMPQQAGGQQLCAPQKTGGQQLCTPNQPQAAPAAAPAQAASTGEIVLAERNTEAPKAVKHSFKLADFEAKLSKKDLDKIVSMYGTGIKDIYDLGPGQKWMFSKASFVTSTFFVQTMFKAIADITPSSFRINTDKVVEKHDNLRTAFAHTGLAKPYQVVLADRKAELEFFDISDTAAEDLDEKLTSLMEADRRRGFDLEKDPLLRVLVYRTPDIDGKQAFAIIVSQPHINIDGASSGILYKELFIDYAMAKRGKKVQEDPEVAFKNYIDWLSTLDKTKEFDYWKEYLKDLNKFKPVPGYRKSNVEYSQSTEVLAFDEEESKKIRSLQRKFKATLNNVVQSAWGVMLQSIFGEKDVAFGAITSGRGAEVAGSAMMMGGMVNAIPVRVNADKETKFSDVVKDMQKNFAASMTNGHCSPEEIQEALGRKEPIFDHLINFHNFQGAGDFANVSIEGITLLGSENFDYLSTDLCVYFGTVMQAFQANFTYNASAFTSKKIRLLAENFKKVLAQVSENPDILVGDIKTDSLEAFVLAEKDAEAERQSMVSFFKGTKIFGALPEEALRNLAEYATEQNFTEDDVIVKDQKEIRDVYLVREGFVELARQNMHGWYNTVKLYKSGDLITPETMFGDSKMQGTLIGASENITVVKIRTDAIRKFIERYPDILENLASLLYSQLKSMTTLWLSAD